MKEKTILYQELRFHYEIGTRQRAQYVKQTTSEEILRKNIVIEVDFKAQIVLGNFLLIRKRL
jgi:hypothetical protein